MSFAFKPGCQAAELMVVLKQKNRVTASGETVCGGKATKARADYHNVVLISCAMNGFVKHNE